MGDGERIRQPSGASIHRTFRLIGVERAPVRQLRVSFWNHRNHQRIPTFAVHAPVHRNQYDHRHQYFHTRSCFSRSLDLWLGALYRLLPVKEWEVSDISPRRVGRRAYQAAPIGLMRDKKHGPRAHVVHLGKIMDLWRGSLLPLGCEAVVNRRVRCTWCSAFGRFWGRLAAQREQAPSSRVCRLP